MTDGFALAPEYAATCADASPVDLPERMTVDWLRETERKNLARFWLPGRVHDDVSYARQAAVRDDASEVDLRWYTRTGTQPGCAAVYVHGGGMVMDDLDVFHGIVSQYVGLSGTPLLAVEYRLAPEHPLPAGLEDVVTAIRWQHHNAGELGVDSARIAVMGDSGGGGLAAMLH